ncbi:MAG TPA: hypothetical protein VFW88_07030 [Burkholderiales bacterium]|nr:hypothetical protein [Burkholderiales bacterium]
MDPTQAGVQLGDLIFQGNDPRNYSKALAQQAAGITALWNASDARAKSMLRNEQLAKRAKPGGFTGDLQKLGYGPDAAGALSDILLSNGTVNLGDLGYFKNPNATEGFAGAKHALETGNLGDYNFDTALATGKPIRGTDVTDGVAYNPFKSPDQPFNAAPTTATESVKPARPGQIHALSKDERLSFFGTPGQEYDSYTQKYVPATVLDTEKYNAFLQWMDQHGFNDERRALPHYRASLQNANNQAAEQVMTNLGIPQAGAPGLGDTQAAPPAALQALRQNPTPALKQQFVEKYGYLPAGLP